MDVNKIGSPASILRLILTPKCNLNCMYCHNEGFDRKHNDFSRLTLPEFEQTALLLKQHGVSSVCITGGDPLLTESFGDILTIVTRVFGGEKTHVSTNGILLHKWINLIKESGVERINISCDAIDETTYERVTGKNEFAKVIENIKKAVEYNFFVNVNCVALKGINTNNDYILSMLDFWKKMEVRLSFLRLCFPFDGLEHYRYDMNEFIRLFDSMGLESTLTRNADRPPTLCYNYHGLEVALRYYVPDRSNHPCAACHKRSVCSEGLYHPRLGLNGMLRSCILRDDLSLNMRHANDIKLLHEFLQMFDSIPPTWGPAGVESP